MRAVLVTYSNEEIVERKIVEINDNHDFGQGPYVDTVPFSVGSNQSIQPIEAYCDINPNTPVGKTFGRVSNERM